MDQKLFEIALGIKEPLFIEKVDFNEKSELHIYINFNQAGRFSCPSCNAADLSVYDTKDKIWRHLDFFQFKCYIHLRNPRMKCPECKSVRQWIPPWSNAGSGFTLLFEAFVVTLAHNMAVLDIAKLVDEYDTRIWRIIHDKVDKAYQNKVFSNVSKIGVDETSSKKGHNYVTVFADVKASDVLYATVGKDASTIQKFVKTMPFHSAHPDNVEEITIDMSPAFISGVGQHLKNASITHDKFHVMKLLNEAVDTVRRQEQKEEPKLKNSRYLWLKNEENLKTGQIEQLKDLQKSNLKTARAYQWKLNFQEIYWTITHPEIAKARLDRWLRGVMHSRLEPLKKFAKMVKKHYDGILRYFTSRLTSGPIESINSRIQEVKRRAKGFRNMDNFINMIYLVCSRLDIQKLTYATHSI
jgi:transposase